MTNLNKYLASAVVGGIVGAAAALLLAPRSGQETRSQLKERGEALLAKPPVPKVSNWGNYPKIEATIHYFEDTAELRKLVQHLPVAIARGNGRCYGDSALAPHIISTLRYNKFLSFDEKQGIIRCQSGVILSELLEVILPKGWFLPVTPGTKLITVGGAIASDVHGKSQHKAGNFSDHLVELELMLADGSIVKCSSQQDEALFWATCGGMGLTGVILNATMKLIPVETGYFCQDSIKAKNLDHLMDLFEESESWPYSVAWIDCMTKGRSMGRGILMRGDHAKLKDLQTSAQRQNPLQPPAKLKLMVPFNFPEIALNSLTVQAFNFLFYHKQLPEMVKSVVDYNSFFYPLDAIHSWNRIYGQRGFTQYQFILPKEKGREGMKLILQKIVDSGMGSFLAVLKLYGNQNGYLPFAMKGYSLALDFAIRPDLFEFLDELDKIVLSYGGRLYLTKDVRMSKEMFMQTYPGAKLFMTKLKKINQPDKFHSLQSDRIGLTT